MQFGFASRPSSVSLSTRMSTRSWRSRSNARIGAGCRLLNERNVENADNPEAGYYIRDRIIIVPKNAMVKDGTVI